MAKATSKFKEQTDWDADDDAAETFASATVITPDGVIEEVAAAKRVVAFDRFSPALRREPTPEEVDRIRRFVGVAAVENEAKLSLIVSGIDAIREQTGKALSAAIQIGREMNAIIAGLDQEEGARILRSAKEIFQSWGESQMSKMMGAARFYDSGRVETRLLPLSYTVLYNLSTLPPVIIDRAVKRDLIRPTISRTEIKQLKVLVEADADAVKSSAVGGFSAEVAALDKEIEAATYSLRALRQKRKRILKIEEAKGSGRRP
jgi:hypothetical protein